MSQASTNATARWTTRIIPILITGAAGYATYVVVPYICADYLYRVKGESGTVVAILVLYFFFFILTIATYLRTILTIKVDAGLVPLGPKAQEAGRKKGSRRGRGKKQDLESQPYFTAPDLNPDSPGLESFYSKDVFVCESDGRPRWCSECRTWKPDRSHHSSEIARCARKMDHYCPWVGGMVSETSFKFFTQFTFYCTLYCAVALAAAGYSLSRQLRDSWPADGRIVSLVALSGFFGLFTFLMTATSIRFIFLNVTNIDMLRKDPVYQLAVRIPRGTPPTDRYSTITYPLPKYPPESTRPPNGHTVPYRVPEDPTSRTESTSPRDGLATRTFAIVKTEPGENPWDLGWKENWKAVMGTNPLEWVLPIGRSPCSIHESMESEYAIGPLLNVLKKRYGIEDSIEGQDGVEMRSIRRDGS